MNATLRPDYNPAAPRRKAMLGTPTLPVGGAGADIAAGMNGTLANVFALHFKTKNYHWHMSGPHFRDHHPTLDEQALQFYAMTDPMAERIRKLGGTTLRSDGHFNRTQRVLDNDADHVEPSDMLAELCDDNQGLAGHPREVHSMCNEYRHIGSASLLESCIDEAERRTWFLFETGRTPDAEGH